MSPYDSERKTMAAPLVMDLRVRVMRDVEAGMSAEKAALKYCVSGRTIYDWKKLQRENGTVEPRGWHRQLGTSCPCGNTTRGLS
jgi:hypothetical protein